MQYVPVMYANSMSLPAIQGYFHTPRIWIAEGIFPSDRCPLDPEMARETAMRRAVGPEVNVRVRRDGLFLFDVSRWSRAATLRARDGAFFSDDALRDKGDLHAARRAQLLNAHQACLSTAESEVGHRSGELGSPIDAEDSIALDDLDREPQDQPGALPIRFALDTATVNASFDVLERMMAVTEVDLVALVALLHLATHRYRRRGFDEANVLSWAVCEQLLRTLWPRHWPSKRVNIARIAKHLSEGNLLPPQLFDELEKARRSRNAWAHELSSRQPSDARASLLAAENMIAHLYGVRIRLPHGYTGGAVWFSDRLPSDAPG